ncbi:VanZ family protein [Xanthobacter autotrophicus DSM 431]|uniref:VanZ family protein n=1 Tax=Xanthobacter nonsaccharivorans TaxID=3119912 RepID=UPI00372CC682
MSHSPILRRQQQIWTTLAVMLWLVITVLSLLPGNERPHTGYSGNAEHFAAYAGAASVTALAFRSWAPVWLVLPFSLASALFEVAQLFIPGRSSGVDNWFFSTFGALVGVLLARWLLRPVLDRLLAPGASPLPGGER